MITTVRLVNTVNHQGTHRSLARTEANNMALAFEERKNFIVRSGGKALKLVSSIQGPGQNLRS